MPGHVSSSHDLALHFKKDDRSITRKFSCQADLNSYWSELLLHVDVKNGRLSNGWLVRGDIPQDARYKSKQPLLSHHKINYQSPSFTFD